MKSYEIKYNNLKTAIEEVFANRKTSMKYPDAFTAVFFEAQETKQRWNNFLFSLGKEQVDFKIVIKELSKFFDEFLKNDQFKK